MKKLKLLLSILREELRGESTEEEEKYRILEEIERVKVKIKLKELGWDDSTKWGNQN